MNVHSQWKIISDHFMTIQSIAIQICLNRLALEYECMIIYDLAEHCKQYSNACIIQTA